MDVATNPAEDPKKMNDNSMKNKGDCHAHIEKFKKSHILD